jgi:hypothetical protein
LSLPRRKTSRLSPKLSQRRHHEFLHALAGCEAVAAAVRERCKRCDILGLEGYLRTPAGPAALRRDNNRKRNPDSPRFRSRALACPTIQAAGLRSRPVEIVQRWRTAELL